MRNREGDSLHPKAPGRIVIISSPSGGGKTSICKALLSEERVAAGWTFSVSYTTRARRKNEVDSREYYFVSEEEFERLASEEFFAEHFRVHLYRYGTPRGPLEKVLTDGGVMLLDVDVQGAERLFAEYPEAITIFIKPPSLDALKDRLQRRGTETPDQLRIREANAIKEMEMNSKFQHVVINEDLNQAVREVLSIINQHTIDSNETRSGTK